MEKTFIYRDKTKQHVNTPASHAYALAFGAHPDDVELSCGGTLLKIIRENRNVAVCDLTKGEMGTLGTPETRAEEARQAARILGYTDRITLDLGDWQLPYTDSSLREIIRVIRYFKPSVIFTNPPDERHPDHMKASRLVYDAVFYSGLEKIETTWNNQAQAPHRPAHLLYYIQFRHLEPHIIVDVSSTFEDSRKGVLAFSTQFYREGQAPETSTLINRKEFLTGLEARARYFGEQIGTKYGEGFQLPSPPAVRHFSDMFS
ncbi:MAG TPA: bacillithiol biosynthesis deacetylase BshB1 [Prosthecochloris aestuarii]|uniref:Bacillithiol biosynthesis deacetylase BshB1 n=1 Tax=Prosthecochloris aestuarii TaxID=1102 RepID=A0A831WVB8_PROAE|nr:bacillithiol biosynthesis deacetylase BshB1 [Prosthecochloris aestuarii]